MLIHRWKKRSLGQGLVEFALILPLILFLMFVIVELARVLYAWIAVENGARFGVRYAVTGEYDATYCVPLYGTACNTRAKEDGARIPSIKDAARSGAVGLLKNEAVPQGTPGFFKITVCSTRDTNGDNISDFTLFPPNASTFTPSSCLPSEDAGAPGSRVSVSVDFDHPLIVPLLSQWWPKLHLTAKREGIVEQFRVARVVGLPATMSFPTFTPTVTNTATSTPTVTDTPLPTDTATVTPTATATGTATQTNTPTITRTPTNTATATMTPTVTNTPTMTPTPDCSLITMTSISFSGTPPYVVVMNVSNSNPVALALTGSNFNWTAAPGLYINRLQWRSSSYWTGNDSTPPSVITGLNRSMPGGGVTSQWNARFAGYAPGVGINGTFTVTLTFGTCTVTGSITRAAPTTTLTPTPTQTPTPTMTATASNTPTITLTPTITNTPTKTNTPTITPTPSKTPTRTNTPTITNTPTKTNTPTITNTPTRTLVPSSTSTRTATTIPPTSTNTRTPTLPAATNTPTITPTPTATVCWDC